MMSFCYLTVYVKPICLAQPSTSIGIGDGVFVAGWGTTLEGGYFKFYNRIQNTRFYSDPKKIKFGRDYL